MIKAVIIENNIEASIYLENLVKDNKEIFNIEINGSARTVKKGITLIRKVMPDIVFLDIELDDGSGFEILDYFTEPTFEIIFVTAYDTYHQKAFDHFAFSYIMKPIQYPELSKVLSRYVKKNSEPDFLSLNNFLKNRNPRIFVYDGKKHIALLLADIIYCEADGNYTHIIRVASKARKLLVNHNLTYFSELLSHKGFFKPSRFYLINTDHIQSILKKDYITLSNGDKIKVSLRNRDKITALIESFK